MNSFIRFTLFSVIFTVSLPVFGWAQDATVSESSASETSSTDEQVSPRDAVEPGQPYDRETFGDWTLRCIRNDSANEPCQLYQLLKDEEGNSVAEITLFPLPVGQRAEAGATVAVPLETLLTRQLTIQVDSASPRRYPFSWCTVQGCYARIGFRAEDVLAFKRGANAFVSIVPLAAPNQTVDLNMSLIGFTAGYNALRDSRG